MTANLFIQAGLRNGVTYLKQSYATPPFKVADITEFKKENWLHLMLMCSSPGILDEDRHEIKIELEENCRMQLDTQSYQRLFNMKKGAIQQTEIFLKKNSSFFYLPHPIVPHENSIFSVHNKIHLSDECVLAIGEVLSCGRKQNGEIFKFTSYHSLNEIFKNGKLVVKENLLIRPASTDVLSIGQLEGYTHQASLLYLDDNYQAGAITQQLHDCLNAEHGIIFGITAAPINGIVVRILGNHAEQLHNCLKEIARQLQIHSIQKSHYPIKSLISLL